MFTDKDVEKIGKTIMIMFAARNQMPQEGVLGIWINLFEKYLPEDSVNKIIKSCENFAISSENFINVGMIIDEVLSSEKLSAGSIWTSLCQSLYSGDYDRYNKLFADNKIVLTCIGISSSNQIRNISEYDSKKYREMFTEEYIKLKKDSASTKMLE